MPYQRKRKDTRKTRPTTKRATSHQKGYTYRWAKAARGFRRENRWCVECLKNGIYTDCHPGPERDYITKGGHAPPSCGCVDHIRPHKGDPELFWNVENWQTLCDGRMGSPDCHGKKTGEGK